MDRGQGTVGTTTGKRRDIKHIALHWIHSFRVNLRGGQWTGDRGQWELLQVRDATSNTLHSIGYTRSDASIYLSIDTVAMYLRRTKRAKT